ncbi:MAG: hypothetical protein K1Y36_13440 [Blastocatellia bacterium]|nr:hypothetical protein [Blastocatellia bacterium]
MEQTELSLVDLFWAVWRRAIWLVVVALVVGAGGYWWANRKVPVYQGTAFVEIGRVDQEAVEEPHLLVEVINAPGFLAKQDDAPVTGVETEEPGKKKKKRRGGAGGRLNAECLETGRKRERIVYLIRITADSEDKGAARSTVETAAQAVIERTNKPFEEAVKLFKTRENELVARLETLRKANAGPVEIAQCEHDLFEVRSKLLTKQTYPTRLALEITAPDVIFSPQPVRYAVLASIAALCLGMMMVVGWEFVRRIGWGIPASAAIAD